MKLKKRFQLQQQIVRYTTKQGKKYYRYGLQELGAALTTEGIGEQKEGIARG